jgi:cytochrome c
VDSFEWNKIAGWALASGVAVLGLIIVSDMTFHTETPEKPGYAIDAPEETAAGPVAVVEKPIAFYLASADAAKGAASFKKCAACHTITKGGANGIGPNLYGIVGAEHAHVAGFGYSSVMAAKKGEPWTFDSLNAWIQSPKTYMPGNKMSFAGIGKAEERANVLAYLNQNSDKPLPLPTVPAEPAAPAPAADTAAAAPAAGAAPAPVTP